MNHALGKAWCHQSRDWCRLLRTFPASKETLEWSISQSDALHLSCVIGLPITCLDVAHAIARQQISEYTYLCFTKLGTEMEIPMNLSTNRHPQRGPPSVSRKNPRSFHFFFPRSFFLVGTISVLRPKMEPPKNFLLSIIPRK